MTTTAPMPATTPATPAAPGTPRALSTGTILSAEQRAALAADTSVGGGNALRSAVAANPHPELPFLRTERPLRTTEGTDQHEFSLNELDRLVQSWSVWYLQRGVSPRDRVAIYLRDSYAYSVHFHALAQIGAISVLINSNAPRDIARSLIGQTTPVGLYTDAERLARVGDIAAEQPGLGWVCTAEEVPAPPAAELPEDARFRHHPEDPVTILHSSGTTGVPKPTIHTHESIVAGPKFRLVDHEELPGAVTMTSLPQSHLGCIAYSNYAVLAGAHTLAAFDRPGDQLVAAVTGQQPTAVMSFAHAYSEIPALDLPAGAVDSVRSWVSMGDAVHEAHIKHLLGLRSPELPKSVFLDRLGTTELGWGVLLKARDLDTARNDRCAGKPVGVAEVVILRQDGTIAGDDEIGLLGARGPAITPGYWGNSDITYRSRLAGYWLTGDNAYRDEHGDHFLVDRAVDAIRTTEGVAYSVFMEEVLLADVDEIVDCAVVAGTTARGAVPVAVVTTRGGAGAQSVLRTANDALAAAGHHRLGALEIARTEADFPLGVTGKVLKRRLREKYAALESHVAAGDPRLIASI